MPTTTMHDSLFSTPRRATPLTLAHDFPFDPTGGYTPEQLRTLKPETEEPADFDAFWRATFEEAMRTPLDWKIRPSDHPGTEEVEVFDIEFASMIGGRVGGWLTRPRGRPATRGAVLTHGYGGRAAPELAPPFSDAVIIQPVLTGLPERSLDPRIRLADGGHVIHGIESRETYAHRWCTADVWRAASVLHEIAPEIKHGRLHYYGGSFGGGIGALALPWDSRFHSAHLNVPSFGNHPLRLQLPCSGSGERVRDYAKEHPEVIKVLQYFDSAIAARRIKIPVHVAAALFDPAVPPAGQFSVYHMLGGPKRLFELSAGHFDHPLCVDEKLPLPEDLKRFFE